MRHALGELRRLLTPPEASTGVVVQVSGGMAKIATRAGLITARASGTIGAGDRVAIEAGVAKAVPAATASYSV